MKLYKVKYYNHISDKTYTKAQAKERVDYLNSTFKKCNAHMVEVDNEEVKTHEYEVIGFYDDIYPMTYTANTLDEAMKLKQKLERDCFDRVEIKKVEK